MQFLQNKVTLYLLGTVVLIYLLSLHNRMTSADESILAEQAYWLAKTGVVKSKLFAGMGQGWEFIQLHYHKLFIWIGALGVYLFGFSWYLFKFITLFFFVAFLIYYYRYLKKQQLRAYTYLALALIIFNFFIFHYSFYYRPEVIMMIFGLMSYVFLEKGLKGNTKFILLSGLFSSICALIHLNGLMFLAAGGLLLLIQKEWRSAVFFSLAGLVGLSLYFVDLMSPEKMNLFIDQLFNDPNVKDDNLSALTLVFKVLNEHQRLFRGPKEIAMTALPVVALLFNFSFLKWHYSHLLIYSAVLVIAMAAIAHGIRPSYSLVYYPFFILIFLLAFKNPERSQAFGRVSVTLVVLYFIIQAFFVIPTFKMNIDLTERVEKINSFIKEDNAKVLATDNFIFNGILHHDINGLLGYRYNLFNYDGKSPDEVPAKDLFDFALKHERQYIVIDAIYTDKRILNMLNFDSLKEGNLYYNYRLVAKVDDFAVFERQDGLSG